MRVTMTQRYDSGCFRSPERPRAGHNPHKISVFLRGVRASVLKLLIFPNPYNIPTPSFVYTPRGRDEGSGEAGAHGIRTGPADL